MFKDWWEYRDYLLENLIVDPLIKEKFRRQFTAYDARYEEGAMLDLVKIQISTLMVNDYWGTKLSNFRPAHARFLKTRGVREDQWTKKTSEVVLSMP